jgi:urease accessory protein
MNLRLLQISDSALPIGGYTHSWGLEASISQGFVRDAESLEKWIRCWLRYAIAPTEGVVLVAAWRAGQLQDWPKVQRANELLTAMIAPPSIRSASEEMGEHLLELAATWTWSVVGVREFLSQFGRTPEAFCWHHAVVFGLLGVLAGADENESLAAYLHQAALGAIGAAVRAIPVGHMHGQQVLAYLHEEIQQLVAAFVYRDLDQASGSCPFYEVLCDEQTRLYARLFRS